MDVLIKAASISNLTDGRYFAAVNAEWMSFVLDPSREDALSVQLAMEFMGWLSGPRYVGEFGATPIAAINETVHTLGLESVEISQPIDAGLLHDKIDAILYRINLAADFSLASLEEEMEKVASYTAQFVLDLSSNGLHWSSLEDAKKAALTSIAAKYPCILQANFTAENVVEMVETVKPLGLQFKGNEEISTGMQLYTKLDPVFEALGWEF